MKTPPELDAITDKVLAYNPDAPKGPLEVIAGAADRPLVIGDVEIPCYVLSDETRVLAQRGMVAGLGMSRGGNPRKGGDRLARFANQNTLKSFISNDLRAGITSPIKFFVSGVIAYGYPATLLVDLCNVVLAAREAGVLQKQQTHIAQQCETLIRGLATVGVIALVDEATGYQHIREERALATILEKFIARELRPWTRTFPITFYTEICRLKEWPSVNAIRRPSVIGKYTNDFVYDRLAPGVLEELQRVNPTLPDGSRRSKHQWFTPEYGHPKLREHLSGVMALMRAAPNWDAFRRSMDRAYPSFGRTIPLNLSEPE